MAYYAKVVNGVVDRVIAATPEYMTSFRDKTPGSWIPMTMKSAGPGWRFDQGLQKFYPPQPFPSWTLNKDTGIWSAPVERPKGQYTWNESTRSWDTFTFPS